MRRRRYEQPYTVEQLPPAWSAAWKAAGPHPALALPIINPFTPKNLSMLPESEASASDVPVRIVDDDLDDDLVAF